MTEAHATMEQLCYVQYILLTVKRLRKSTPQL